MISESNISKKLGLNIAGHKDIDFVDINLNHDTTLFIDPCLIECQDDDFSKKCSDTITDYFQKMYSVFEKNVRHDIYLHLSHLGERNEARLGYGNGRNGKAKTAEGMRETLSDLSYLIQNGIPVERAIDIALLMPRFAEDCMSDMLMNILYKLFSEYTVQQCRILGIPTKRSNKKRYYWDCEEHIWKLYEGESLIINGEIIILVPKRYVCTRLYYSTQQFFMSKIAPMLQKRDAIVINGKEKKTNKQDVKKTECREHGSLLCAVIEHTRRNPRLLEEYHIDIPQNYAERCLSDSFLDFLVYGTLTDVA